MTRDQIVWRTAHPLWRTGHGQGARFEAPAVLRLAGDDFMEQFEAALSDDAGLAPLVAGRETWQHEGAGIDHEAPATEPITLFQPTHGRFYLAAASLVCRRYGHPDRRVAADHGEAVSFLLRRLAPRATSPQPIDPTTPATFVEYGWVSDSWQPVSATVAPELEQRLPLFAMTTAPGPSRRRLLAGLIPVSRREELHPPPTLRPEDVGSDSQDPLAVLADERVQPLEPLVAGLQSLWGEVGTVDSDQLAVARESLFFLMVDLADWLDGPDGHLPGSLADDPTVLDLADRTFVGSTSWRDALAAALANQTSAETGEPELVAGLSPRQIEGAIDALFVDSGDTAPDGPDTAPTHTKFFTRIHHALLERTDSADAAESAGEPAADPSDPNSVYVVRCLYERPRCRPSERQHLSQPSRPFRLAAFYEPDAPSRPVRIPFPVDTSPGGLRRFPKNVSVVLSSELRKQMQRATPKTLREGQLGSSSGVNFGMICQLSIPIITICALILLMIIVQILNLVFFWLPLFKICLPIPTARTE